MCYQDFKGIEKVGPRKSILYFGRSPSGLAKVLKPAPSAYRSGPAVGDCVLLLKVGVAENAAKPVPANSISC